MWIGTYNQTHVYNLKIINQCEEIIKKKWKDVGTYPSHSMFFIFILRFKNFKSA